MKLLFVADPIESFKIYKDTTFAMMRAAQRRGHLLSVCEPRHLHWTSGGLVQAQTASCASALSQAGAVGALNGLQSSIENLRLTLQNSALVMNRELRAFNGVFLREPQGTFYCLADFSAYEKDSVKLANLLLEKVMVVTVPGVSFGAEGHLRLSTCGPIKQIMDGVARIKWVLDPESPNEIFIGDRKLVRNWN